MANFFMQLSRYAIPAIFLIIPLYAWFKKVPVYESFVEGAKEGLFVTLRILPYLMGMLLAIGIFRAAGAFDLISNILAPLTSKIGLPSEVVPLAFMRPLSGTGALAMTADILSTYGPDSFIGRLASVIQGSTDTTFYIITVYFGSVGIRRYRHALTVGLIADAASMIAAFCFCYLYFS